MINKIFYSLVLFPNIIYHSWEIWDWYHLDSVKEIEIWTFLVWFGKIDNQNENKFVYFKHKKFVKKSEKVDIKNWKIYWEDEKMVNATIYKLKDVDKTRDFNFFEDKDYYNKIAFWVVLTITSRCNLFCYYCFNDVDYDLKTRNTRKNMELDYWKKIVDHLYENKTRVIILSWWEPMSAPFFWELLGYLKLKNIFVHINTNWTLLNQENIKRLNRQFSVNIMVSMHEFNNKDFYNVNKLWLNKSHWIDKISPIFKIMFYNKVIQLRKINDLENISLEFLTILNWKNILNLEKIYEFWIKSWIYIHNWQFFRLYWTKNNKGATKAMMNLAINKMYEMNKKYWFNYKIVDPVPFCVVKDIDKARNIVDWVLSDTHNVKTIITTQWFVQMMSAYDSNFWNINNTSIKEIFKSDFVKKMLNNRFLPKECEDCIYKDECKWWSRMDANIVYWDYNLVDPLCDLNNKVTNRKKI